MFKSGPIPTLFVVAERGTTMYFQNANIDDIKVWKCKPLVKRDKKSTCNNVHFGSQCNRFGLQALP